MIKKRNKYLAFLLSLITPGLGHLYIGQLKSATLIPIIYILITFILITLSIASTFSGLVVFISFVIVFYITIAIISFKKSRNLTDYTLKNFNKIIIYLLWPLMFFGADFIVSSNNTLSTFSIPTAGMEKTLKVNDLIFADMNFYNENEIKRNDILIFKNVENDNLLIKRVIGLGGEKISMNKGRIYISGEYHKENNPNIIVDSLSNFSSFDEILIPVNHFFVMGDNRGNSKDSRIFGPINLNQIKGKPLYIYYSETINRISNKIK
jgi:signal peptidase I